jgi:hypothetical protein
MIRQNLVLTILSVVFILSHQSLYAFENKNTHPALTDKSVVASIIDDYLKTQVGLGDGINTQLSYNFPSEIQTRINRTKWDGGKTKRTLLEWIKVGSAIEDEDEYPAYSIRSRHHLYDPIRNAGWNNHDDNPHWIGWPATVLGLRGGSAMEWAINGMAPLRPILNYQSWQSAREDFYAALTNSTKSDREKYLAMTFLDLGCVLHVLEDMGIPAHTRNDVLFEHYRNKNDNGSPFEKYVERHVMRTGGLSNWLSANWYPTPKVFSKVADYFDTDTRNGIDYFAGNVPGTWGLAECTNYQFLSWSTIFRPDDGNLYFFPHPALAETDPLVEGRYQYRSGYGVQHLTRHTMSSDYLLYPNNLDRAYVVIDGKTLYDYAEITIPRTIDYVTGLANYFFRGKLSIEDIYYDSGSGKWIATIKNTSKNYNIEQVLYGGSFEMYWEDCQGNRTQVTDLSVDNWVVGQSILDFDDSVTARFTLPSGAAAKSIIAVYKGPINDSQHPYAIDCDDLNAIAVSSPGELPIIIVMCWIDEACCWADPSLQYFYNASLYNEDLAEYSPTTFTRSGCRVPEHPDLSPGIWPVLPSGYAAPAEISVETCGRPPSFNEIIEDFDQIRGDVFPGYLLLCVDDSGSMTYSTIQPGYDDFKLWISENYPGITIVEWPFYDERWIKAINEGIQYILDNY